MTTFGERLKHLREVAGMSQAELASKAGCKQAAISMWEAGKREPGWSAIQTLAAGLGVEVMAFVEKPKRKGK